MKFLRFLCFGIFCVLFTSCGQNDSDGGSAKEPKPPPANAQTEVKSSGSAAAHTTTTAPPSKSKDNSQSLLSKILPTDTSHFSSMIAQPGRSSKKVEFNFSVQKADDHYLLTLPNNSEPDEIVVREVEGKYLKFGREGGRAKFWLALGDAPEAPLKMYMERDLPTEASTPVACHRIESPSVLALLNGRTWEHRPLAIAVWTFETQEGGETQFSLDTPGGRSTFSSTPKNASDATKSACSFALDDGKGSKVIQLLYKDSNSVELLIDGDRHTLSASTTRQGDMEPFASPTHRWFEMLGPAGDDLTALQARIRDIQEIQGDIRGRLKKPRRGPEWLAKEGTDIEAHFSKAYGTTPPPKFRGWQVLAVSETELAKGWPGNPVWVSEEWPIKSGADFENSLRAMKAPALIFVPEISMKVVLPGTPTSSFERLKDRQFKVIVSK